jgi:hypothetical protein
MIHKIISGGQTGVDRAALDVAISEGIDIGGSCPAGREADDGPIPEKYLLQETADTDPFVRTENNVRDSDGSLLLYRDKLHGGTAYAMEMARQLGRPVKAVDVSAPPSVADVADWIEQNRLHVLHIGGQRENSSPGIYQQASAFIKDVLDAFKH